MAVRLFCCIRFFPVSASFLFASYICNISCSLSAITHRYFFTFRSYSLYFHFLQYVYILFFPFLFLRFCSKSDSSSKLTIFFSPIPWNYPAVFHRYYTVSPVIITRFLNKHWQQLTNFGKGGLQRICAVLRYRISERSPNGGRSRRR